MRNSFRLTRVIFCLLLMAAVIFGVSDSFAEQSPTRDASQSLQLFNKSVEPLLAKYCHGCHGPSEQESDLRIDELDPDLVKGQHGGKWRELLDALNRGNMPPDDEPQPTAEERDAIIDWLTAELQRAAELRRSTGGHVTMRRLTRDEYNNTMRDLLGIELDFSRELPPDSKGIDGYKNNGQFLGMSELQLEEYYKAAKMGLAAAIVQGEPPPRIQQKITESSKNVRFDSLTAAPFNKEIGGTVIGAPAQDPNAKKKGGNKQYAMCLNCLDPLPLTGTFRVRITASATERSDRFAPPRMHVAIGHKTGVKVEPQKTLGEADVDAQLGTPQTFEYAGRLEEFPLHTGDATKKFPGLRVIITDANSGTGNVIAKKDAANGTPSSSEKPPQLVIYSIEFETPIDPAWPPSSHTQILPPRDNDVEDEAYLQDVLKRFISRAYRRPATQDEIEWAMQYYAKLRPTTDTFEDAVQEVLALVLMSPKFLYLPEFQPQKAGEKKVPLSNHELATRLSYFLWGTMPDDQLQNLAANDELSNDTALGMQVQRMLSDERSWQFVESFSSQWLNLDGVDAVAINPDFFPDFDNALKEDMKQESVHFFAEVLYEDLSCLNFLDSDFVMLNDRLAEFYGMEKPRSGQFKKVKLPADSVRGGVLTQASFLLGTSTGAESHPIYRAKWFLDRVMGDPPGDPPADVPELDEKSVELAKLTLKQKLDVHRKRASCNRCHRNLDPWGIPFEEFNGIGQHLGDLTPSRNKKSVGTIEIDTTLPDGTEVVGSKQLVEYLLKTQKAKFSEAFCRHLLTYALGRSLEWTDQPLVDQLSSDFRSNGYKMNRLILKIVQSDAFRTK